MKKILIVEDEAVVREKLLLEIEWSEEIDKGKKSLYW